MFEQNYGSKGTRWLYWFMGAMIAYALSTLWPENRTAVSLGGGFAALGVGIARYQISKARREK